METHKKIKLRKPTNNTKTERLKEEKKKHTKLNNTQTEDFECKKKKKSTHSTTIHLVEEAVCQPTRTTLVLL